MKLKKLLYYCIVLDIAMAMATHHGCRLLRSIDFLSGSSDGLSLVPLGTTYVCRKYLLATPEALNADSCLFSFSFQCHFDLFSSLSAVKSNEGISGAGRLH